MRRAHYLGHNKGREYPRDVVIVDTETVPETLPDGATAHRLAFGWAFGARRKHGDRWQAQRWHRFETRAGFWSWALKRARKGARLVIYCHNAEFDAMVLDAFGELERRRWRLVQACLEGPPTIIAWRRGRRTVMLLDTLNLWRMPLAEIGARLGLPKLEMPGDWSDREKADAYCRRDVEIVWRALLAWWRFLAEHDLGTAAPTLAGQALNAFRHRFMRHPIFCDSNERALELARAAYYGGRVEAFRLGRLPGPGRVLDVNSMYPAVMADLLAPTSLLTVRGAITPDQLADYLARYACVARVRIATGEPAYPVILDGRLCFPVGEFEAVLASPELAYALEHKHVVDVLQCVIYERAPIFREFVAWCWSERLKAIEAGDQVQAWLLKILANSLYGKFGQRARQWHVVGEAEDSAVRTYESFDADRGQVVRWRQIGRVLQRLDDDGEAHNSHPAIAAHVTSAARMRLWALIRQAGREHVWYCDTDSLVVSLEGAELLASEIDPHRLGALKLEREFAEGEIRGLKDYRLGVVAKTKGVSRSATWVDQDAAVQEQWLGWAGAIAAGRLDAPVSRPVLKVMQRRYLKGEVLPDGRVRPWRLPLPAPRGGPGQDSPPV